jgi:hypothetical protein
MATSKSQTPPVNAPLGQLERALIDEFLLARGQDLRRLTTLSAAERDALLRDAAAYASAKLAEVESRSHYLHEIHDTEH